ncbi:MAG: peptidase [Fibrobacteres bacterium]|nr:peptidase [Fibrobacterota bacterium]
MNPFSAFSPARLGLPGLALAVAVCAASVSAAGHLIASAPQVAAAGPSGVVNDDSWVRVAVVAASAKGLDGDRPLRYAYRDGERLETMLSSVGQIEPANLFLLKAESRNEFRKSLLLIGDKIADLKGKNRKVFLQFYYSGHGGAKRFHFADGTMSFDEVKSALGGDRPERLRADARVYVLDVCFGASFFNAKGFRTAPPVQLQMEMDQAARGEVTISSSSVDEQAYEVKTLGGSIFTSHWIMALRGAGDRNRDGQVTLFEAYNYAYDRTSGYSAETLDRPQHPSFQMDLTGARDVTLARLLRSTTGILFKGCPAGLYNVVDLQRGIQIGELRIPQGEEFTLALEPGRYRVVYLPGKPGSSPSQAADLELANSAMATLPFAAFQVQTAAQGLPKGSGYPDEVLDKDADGPVVLNASAGTEGSVIGDGSPAGPARPAEGAGLWTRMGYAVWAGAAGFEDATLDRGMNTVPEVDRYFGTAGYFSKPSLKSDWGIDMTFALMGAWTLGARFAFSDAEYTLEAVGREPLNTLPDSSRALYPVRLSSTYAITDARYGVFLGRTFQVTRAQGFFAEAAVSHVTRSVQGDRSLDRPLYKTSKHTVSEFSGDGVRLDAGLGYRMLMPRSLFGKGLTLGVRVSPYLTRVGGLRDDEGNALSAEEAGCSVALTINLMGRSAGASPAPSPRRNP